MTEKAFCPSCNKPITHRLGVEWCQDHQMSEKTLQNRVIDRARRRGWKVAHAGRAWVGDQVTGEGTFITQMSKGWPDAMLFNAKMTGHKVVAMEFKREEGEVEPEQLEWLLLMNACGIPAIVVRPSDLREGRVTAVLEGK